MMDKLWGAYEILLSESDCKVKKIVVNPSKRLSYQSHKKRSEVWVIISGEGKLTLNDDETLVEPGDILSIPTEAKHRIENTGNSADLVFIEVQRGTYFGEDDITRYEDDWGRHRDNWSDCDDDLR